MLFIVFPNHHISNPTAYHDALLKSESFEPPWPHQPSTIPWLPLPPQVENHSWNFWGQPQNSATKLGFLLHYFYSLPTRVEIKPRGLPFFQFMNLGIPKLKWFKWFTNKTNRNTTKSKGLIFSLGHGAIYFSFGMPTWILHQWILGWHRPRGVKPGAYHQNCQVLGLHPGSAGKPVQRQSVFALTVFSIFLWAVTTKNKGEREREIYIYLFIILYA